MTDETLAVDDNTPSPDEKIITSPLKAIKAKCLDCCCDSALEVKLCPVKKCPLYAFRFGKNPYLPKREYTEEEKAVLRIHLNRIRPLIGKKKEGQAHDGG